MVKATKSPQGGLAATLRPIAGTRRRGQTLQEDDDLAQELLQVPKEIAEHIMLVDLGRNDVGRVAATGTVYGCLGHDQKVELRDILRNGGADAVTSALDRLLAGKPKGHQFRIGAAQPAVERHMSVTGG